MSLSMAIGSMSPGDDTIVDRGMDDRRHQSTSVGARQELKSPIAGQSGMSKSVKRICARIPRLKL